MSISTDDSIILQYQQQQQQQQTAIFQENPSKVDARMSPFWILLQETNNGGGGNNSSYETCKTPVKLSPSTNQLTANIYRPNAPPVVQPTVSEH